MDKNREFDVEELEACRREFQSLQKSTDLLLSLAESGYCGHCAPNEAEQSISLSITYDDGSTRTISPVSLIDLRILRDFFKGGLAYETFNDGLFPLKKELPRLSELLGISLHETNQEKI